MANIIYKDGLGNTKYRKATGSGTDIDPTVTHQNIDNFPTSSSSVWVENPLSFTLSGSGITVTAGSIVNVANFPAIQTIGGSVIDNMLSVLGSVSGSAISSGSTGGTIHDLMAGLVTLVSDTTPSPISGSVSIANFPVTQPVTVTTASAIITGSFVVGNSLTNPMNLNGLQAIGVTTGSNLSATTLTFLVSQDMVNFNSLYDFDSLEVSISASSVARTYALDPSLFYGWNSIKIREGTSASAVNQTAANSIIYLNTKKV